MLVSAESGKEILLMKGKRFSVERIGVDKMAGARGGTIIGKLGQPTSAPGG